nr:transposon TX1 putative 149 kDa protein [Tanacetum cinerariifolium]
MNVLGDEDENRPNHVQDEIIYSSAKKKNTSNIWNEEINKSVCSDHFKSNELLRSGGSILQVMEGCINTIEEIIKSQGVNEGLEEIHLGGYSFTWCKTASKMSKPDRFLIFEGIDIDKLESMELAQIAKIKWGIEGDENTKYYRGTLNKQRSQLAISENDVVKVVNMFFHNATFTKGDNASFIALISKTHDANMVKYFQPITLIGSLYKIIAKILAKCLVSVLGHIGDPLSPLLFLLVMKSLHLSVQRVVDAGLFR